MYLSKVNHEYYKKEINGLIMKKNFTNEYQQVYEETLERLQTKLS